MADNQRGSVVVNVLWVVAGLLVAIAAGWQIVREARGTAVEFSTLYQAVLLTNGSVYFGHLNG
jgi:hypothetical protein